MRVSVFVAVAFALSACESVHERPPLEVPCLGAPSSLAVTYGPLGPDQRSQGLALSWVDGATCESGFEIERAVPSGAFQLLATVAADATGYVDVTLVAPAADAFCYGCSYRVRAVAAGGGASEWSNVAIAPGSPPAGPPPTPPCLGAPSSLLVYYGPIGPIGPGGSPQPTGLALWWTDNATCESGFEIERAFQPLATVGADVTSYLDSQLMWVAPDVYSYCYGCSYRVRAIAAGASMASAWSNTAVAPPPPPPGPAPP